MERRIAVTAILRNPQGGEAMITTPLGKIKVCADGICIDYTAAEIDFNRPPCKEKPIAGCYRIEVESQGRKAITCTLVPFDPNLHNSGNSGQDYLNAEFIKGNTILTMGMEDENPAFESVRTEYGLQYNLLRAVDKVVFGVAWATDYEGASDCRTWFAADPTIIIR
ncbi:MAG: hypothetical protein IJY86_06760 [Clostridia bacterium]|nr:hypothetical protein [Clostridia bacterium]